MGAGSFAEGRLFGHVRSSSPLAFTGSWSRSLELREQNPSFLGAPLASICIPRRSAMPELCLLRINMVGVRHDNRLP